MSCTHVVVEVLSGGRLVEVDLQQRADDVSKAVVAASDGEKRSPTW